MKLLDTEAAARSSSPASAMALSGHVVFPNSDWPFYEQVLRRAGEQPLRVNFSEGVLEIMTLSYEHERYKMAMHSVILGLSIGLKVPALSAGSPTLKHKLIAKGLEPDQCYYVQHAEALQGRKQIDLRRDPPPDLVVEIDITHRAVDRERIYHAFNVPEMWTFDGLAIRGFKRSKTGWRKVERSMAFPSLRVGDLNEFVPLFARADSTLILRVSEWAASIR
jgi:Uma2 family endonuclease